MSKQAFHVAIVGGGLCGLSLALALSKRSISYTIYEARSSFTEIGAGINLGPNIIQAFDLIDPSISKAVFALATRNPPGLEDVWMNVRIGATTEQFKDGHLAASVMASPTGNMTTSRNELLRLLAKSISLSNARFNKKLNSIEQSQAGVTLVFEDGTRDTASLMIGCDGAHSTVRSLLLGSDNPATTAEFSHTGIYRAVLPMSVAEEALGADKAHMSTIWTGPSGYVIHYPIDGGTNLNIGCVQLKDIEWKADDPWIISNQKAEMLRDFEAWGSTIQDLMKLMSDDTAFWATFHHTVKPQSYHKGRICMIGDASHGMCPHQGQGAAQSMEDACVMAEVLSNIDAQNNAHPMLHQIEAAFAGYEAVRAPRFENVIRTSREGYHFWADLWRPDLTRQDLDAFQEKSVEWFGWIWNADIAGQGDRAKAEMQRYLGFRAQPHTYNTKL